jgi:putative PIN family toxin of toxin-antitoxin system
VRVILDTNILISALTSQAGPPAGIYRAWLHGAFVPITSREQIDELETTLAKPAIVLGIVRRSEAGTMVNHLLNLAEFVSPLPKVRRSIDPEDDYLLAMAEADKADFLVSGDKAGLLALVRHAGASIISPRAFATIVG